MKFMISLIALTIGLTPATALVVTPTALRASQTYGITSGPDSLANYTRDYVSADFGSKFSSVFSDSATGLKPYYSFDYGTGSYTQTGTPSYDVAIAGLLSYESASKISFTANTIAALSQAGVIEGGGPENWFTSYVVLIYDFTIDAAAYVQTSEQRTYGSNGLDFYSSGAFGYNSEIIVGKDGNINLSDPGTLIQAGTYSYLKLVESHKNYTPTGFGSLTTSLMISAVPEPKSWAMMLLGFGILGGVARREKRSISSARSA